MPSVPLSLQLLGVRADGRSRMAVALLLSLCLHAALLAWHASAPRPAAPRAAVLEVTLVNSHSAEAPLAPQALAQRSLDGGGEHAQGMAATPLPRIDAADDDDQLLLALRQRQALLEAEQQRLLTLLAADVPAASAQRPLSDDPGREAEAGEDDLPQDSQWIQARVAALKEQVQRYNAQPRQRFIAPSTLEAAQARYVEAWRERIELIGTRHYPPEARGRIYGDLQLTVFIRRDGRLERVQFDRPSEHAVLNSAARRIIELAAPFDPLPAELAQDTDVLAITRTWQFTPGGVGTAAGSAPATSTAPAGADATGADTDPRP